MQISKQAAQAIDAMEASRVQQAVDERTKRQITENQDAIEFWIATARHWHKRATFLEGVAQREKDTTTQAVTEMQAQAMERDHWKQRAEQNHGDTMAAERRSDAMGDIMDALARGWRMESYDGCAKWWRYDTDTLAALAKEAREWEQAEDSKPTDAKGQPLDPITEVVNITPADGEEFQIGSTLYQHAEPCDCQAYPILGHETPAETQSGYNRLKHATSLIMQLPVDHDGRNTWLMNYAERKDPAEQGLIRSNPGKYAEPGDALGEILRAKERWTVWEWGHKPNGMADNAIVEIEIHGGARNTLEASVIDWQQVKAYRTIQKHPDVDAEHAADPDQVNPIDDGKAAQQADGFNGHMIGTDGDRVGFIWHAAKYGFKSEYNPESATSAQIEDDYNRAFAYMQTNCYPLKPQ